MVTPYSYRTDGSRRQASCVHAGTLTAKIRFSISLPLALRPIPFQHHHGRHCGGIVMTTTGMRILLPLESPCLFIRISMDWGSISCDPETENSTSTHLRSDLMR